MKMKNDAMVIKNITAIEKAKMQMKAFVYKDSPYKRLLSLKCVINKIHKKIKNHLVTKLIGYKV